MMVLGITAFHKLSEGGKVRGKEMGIKDVRAGKFFMRWIFLPVSTIPLFPLFKVTSAKATVFDLAQNLRDGVLLCLLLNKLSPGAVDKNDISQRPQMSQFLCLKNIRTFLQVS